MNFLYNLKLNIDLRAEWESRGLVEHTLSRVYTARTRVGGAAANSTFLKPTESCQGINKTDSRCDEPGRFGSHSAVQNERNRSKKINDSINVAPGAKLSRSLVQRPGSVEYQAHLLCRIGEAMFQRPRFPSPLQINCFQNASLITNLKWINLRPSW